MRILSIDLETRSPVDLSRASVYRYAESPDFEILLFGVSVDDGPVRVYDLASGEKLPEEILSALRNPAVEKWAYNCAFERVCLSFWLRKVQPALLPQSGEELPFLSPEGWRCSMILAACAGLPFGLEKVGEILGLEERKLKAGKDLIRFFCRPGGTDDLEKPVWHSPEEDPAGWELFKRYNARDVEVEMEIRRRLRFLPVPVFLWSEYALDQRINDRGIRVDLPLVRQAILLDQRSRVRLTERMKRLTGLENPNSVPQLKRFLASRGLTVDSLGKAEVRRLMDSVPENLREVLSLRSQLAKSSVRKYQAMEAGVSRDGRCRGLFQFYGAARTGRWAGRLIQLQNLPQNHLEDLEEARSLVREGKEDLLARRFPSVPEVLSDLIRTAFLPRDGEKFIVADFSAVEARALSWLAKERWRMEVFHDGRDIYCESASRMFHCVVEKHGPNSDLRPRGKVAELALGYGGGVGALRTMGAVEMGVPEEELSLLVERWRRANPNIVRFWWDVDAAARSAVREGVSRDVGCFRFEMRSGILFALLPSGRFLAYPKPRLGQNQFGGECVTFMGLDAQKRWTRLETYGPKLVENLTQALCRDLLAFVLKNLRDYRVVAHVHDEVILEVPRSVSVEEITELMSRTPPWAPGLELRADGSELEYYCKS